MNMHFATGKYQCSFTPIFAISKKVQKQQAAWKKTGTLRKAHPFTVEAKSGISTLEMFGIFQKMSNMYALSDPAV